MDIILLLFQFSGKENNKMTYISAPQLSSRLKKSSILAIDYLISGRFYGNIPNELCGLYNKLYTLCFSFPVGKIQRDLCANSFGFRVLEN